MARSGSAEKKRRARLPYVISCASLNDRMHGSAEVVDEHDAEQAARFGEDAGELRTSIEEFRGDELTQREAAINYQAREAPACDRPRNASKRLAIWLSTRIWPLPVSGQRGNRSRRCRPSPNRRRARASSRRGRGRTPTAQRPGPSPAEESPRRTPRPDPGVGASSHRYRRRRRRCT